MVKEKKLLMVQLFFSEFTLTIRMRLQQALILAQKQVRPYSPTSHKKKKFFSSQILLSK